MFDQIIYLSIAIVGITLIGSILLIIRSKNNYTRAVLSDMVFYSMIACYVMWSMLNETQIAYEIILLAALVGGVLPTMSIARIISKGRR